MKTPDNKTGRLIVGCVAALLVPWSVSAWEPGAKELDSAVASGDFAAYHANATAWLNQKVPAVVTDEAIKGLLKDAVFVNILDQAEFISKCGADKLGAFAKADATNPAFLVWLLKNTQAMDSYLEGVVPAEKKYISSLEILRTIIKADPDAREGMCLRLAIATAQVHADPSRCFGYSEVIDPVKRYQYFKAACKAGELAPYFDDLSTWEYAKVVDTAASDKDLSWAREMLKTMRPELVREARYVRMVSEVQYGKANWGPKPHNMATILNGGGACGPRAWFGRMINSAFGVPVWGVKQPGHAAVGFLGNEGWKVMYGRGWDKSTWGGMNGNKFLEIVRERQYAMDFSQVEHLRSLAGMLKSKEQANAVKNVAEQIRKAPKGPRTEHKLTCTKYPPAQDEKPWQPVPGVQRILASACIKKSNASCVPSFDFGKQANFPKNVEGWAEYKVSIPKGETYGITLGHAVANGNCRVRIYVGDTKIGWMHLNNTTGLWGKTKEVDFALPQTDTLRFVFPKQRGVALKWIELRAKGNAPAGNADPEPKMEAQEEVLDSLNAEKPE